MNRLYLEDGADIARELYLSVLVDRNNSKVSLVASTEGGMEFETVAHDTPEKIHILAINSLKGFIVVSRSPAKLGEALIQAIDLTCLAGQASRLNCALPACHFLEVSNFQNH